MDTTEGGRNGAESLISAGLAPPSAVVGKGLAGALRFIQDTFCHLLRAMKTGLSILLVVLFAYPNGNFRPAFMVLGLMVSVLVLLLVLWAAIIFLSYTQYSLKTMLMVVLVEGLFTSCALSDPEPVAATGLVLALVFPVLLSLVTVLMYDPVLRERLLRGRKPGLVR